jgi:hypothetical protein
MPSAGIIQSIELEAGHHYRLEYLAPYELSTDPETATTLERQSDLNLELAPLGAYAIRYVGRKLIFALSPVDEPRTVTVGAPLSSSPAAGSSVVLRKVTELGEPDEAP